MPNKEIPYKIYLEESEMPESWYNVRADMPVKPALLLNPATGAPMTAEEMSAARGTATEPGTPSPWRDRTVEENLDLFARMKAACIIRDII